MDDHFLTINSESTTEIKIKASRFIGETFLVQTVDEARERLGSVCRREYSANHHCYAWRVGVAPDSSFKYSDDGEPNGTAGKPIYDVLAGHKLTNSLVVVTRYFGGTKLGTGGLVRAYGEAARSVIELSGTRDNYLMTRYRIEMDFRQYDRWMKITNRLDAGVIKSDFSDVVTMEIEIRQARSEELRNAFVELTAGKGKIETL